MYCILSFCCLCTAVRFSCFFCIVDDGFPSSSSCEHSGLFMSFMFTAVLFTFTDICAFSLAFCVHLSVFSPLCCVSTPVYTNALRICTPLSLIMICLVRTMHLNLLRLRDPYVHANCLAVLSNVAPLCDDMHPCTAQVRV